MNSAEYYFCCCAFSEAPIYLHAAVILFQDGSSELLPSAKIYRGNWGNFSTIIIPNRESYSAPLTLYISYYSVNEDTHYINEINFEETGLTSKIDKFYQGSSNERRLIFGIAPFGKIIIWSLDIEKQEIVYISNSKRIEESSMGLTYDVKSIINYDSIKDKISNHSKNYYDILLKHYSYRYVIEFTNGNILSNEYNLKKIYYTSFNGSFYRDDNLETKVNYSSKGLVSRLSLYFCKQKAEFIAHVFFDLPQIVNVFNKFYGNHIDTKTDFIIRIDAENKKYELALYRQGLKEPVVIPESAYQLIVFKNKFEDYRSENYNQPRGAWIW